MAENTYVKQPMPSSSQRDAALCSSAGVGLLGLEVRRASRRRCKDLTTKSLGFGR